MPRGGLLSPTRELRSLLGMPRRRGDTLELPKMFGEGTRPTLSGFATMTGLVIPTMSSRRGITKLGGMLVTEHPG